MLAHTRPAWFSCPGPMGGVPVGTSRALHRAGRCDSGHLHALQEAKLREGILLGEAFKKIYLRNSAPEIPTRVNMLETFENVPVAIVASAEMLMFCTVAR